MIAFLMALAMAATPEPATADARARALPILTPNDVTWVKWPDKKLRFYPPHALEEGIQGEVVVECVVSEPGDQLFGEVTLKVMKYLKVAPTLRNGEPSAGRVLRYPMHWRLQG